MCCRIATCYAKTDVLQAASAASQTSSADMSPSEFLGDLVCHDLSLRSFCVLKSGVRMHSRSQHKHFRRHGRDTPTRVSLMRLEARATPLTCARTAELQARPSISEDFRSSHYLAMQNYLGGPGTSIPATVLGILCALRGVNLGLRRSGGTFANWKTAMDHFVVYARPLPPNSRATRGLCGVWD